MIVIRKPSARVKAIFAATLASLMLSVSSPAAFAQAAAPAMQQQSVVQVQDEVRNVLTQYGRFVQHAKYGEVWVPTVTPQGWHPYPPCNWVNTKKYGWYYDDKTAWGQIVHHYGRWVSDPQMGWIWTPGAEFSPGWVVWRTSPEWIGWAPMLPDEDIKTVAASDADNAASWIFVETQKFAQGCNPVIQAPPSQVPMLITQTTYVTDIRLVYGITVIVLPSYIWGPWIDIDIWFGPWPNWFLAQTLIDWNFIWNKVAAPIKVVYQNCPKPVAPPPLPISNPMPPTPPRPLPPRVDNNPPVIVVNPTCPPGTRFDDGACRLADPCRPGTIRLGNSCVPEIRPDPRPPVVINNPCSQLSGAEFQRCIRGTPPPKPVDHPPVKGPVAGGGDTRPGGHVPPTTGGPTGPVGGVTGNPDPHKPIGTPHPIDVVHPVGPPSRLPSTTLPPIRPNPNPVVLSPGGGGLNKATVGSNQQASNNAVTPHRMLPVALPKRGPNNVR
jgi:hypothetical protein